MDEIQKESPDQRLTEAMDENVRDDLTTLRTKFLTSRNNTKHEVSAHILWVSATVFAVIVIAGRAEYGALFLVSVVLNALCILACSISLHEPVDSADRSQRALARALQGKGSTRSGRFGAKEIRRTSHRGVTVFCSDNGKGGTIAQVHEGKRKVFGVCRAVAYLCFVLMVICLAVFALTK